MLMKQNTLKTENLAAWFDSPEFEAAYHCDLPMGALWTPEKTVFRLWAPTAERVRLRLFREGTGGAALKELELKPGERGLWSAEAAGNLHGVYYDYLVTVDGICRRTADPYARACSLNGERSMAVDLRRTDPPGWEADRAPAKKAETVIYEVHVKDFSWDPACGVKPEWRGRFPALTQEGTSLNGDGLHPTGLDYLKGLGITHVQLMPVFDYGSVDEGGSPEQFNWGYDPVNYNVPEGSYSTDPARGEVRIRELKEAVQALHRAGLRVVMDVRQWPDGEASNGSGCGCDLATERSMCGKYVLDSVLYWAEEYHMDGFRFDLMGLLDTELMNSIRRALDQRYGPGEKLMLGEPWAADRTAVRPGTYLSDKENLSRLDKGIAAFCDNTRDAVKGSLFRSDARGLANGGGLDPERLRSCLRGWAGEGLPTRAPSQTVSYLSAHDDWTLWDRLVLTLDPAAGFNAPTTTLLRANRFAAAVCFSCQGQLFLLSGEEFGRTKQGVQNTYNAAPSLNRLDWERAWRFEELADYYRGLLALRQRLPGLCDKSPRAGERFSPVRVPAPGCAVFELDNGVGSPWRRLFLAYNAGEGEASFRLPPGRWELLLDGSSSWKWKSPETAEGRFTLPPVSAAFFGLI